MFRLRPISVVRCPLQTKHRAVPLEFGGAALRQAQASRLEASHRGFRSAELEGQSWLQVSPFKSEIRNSQFEIISGQTFFLVLFWHESC